LKCYRARISDGSRMTEFVLFYQNLTRRVKVLQECNFPFISIIEYDNLIMINDLFKSYNKFRDLLDFDTVVICLAVS
jgi:hypothetical protein